MILIIDNYDSFTYNLYQVISAYNNDVRVFRNDEITCEEINALNPSGIAISPGPGRPEDAGICIQLIKEFSGKIPLLGVCLGHQAIAMAFGGNVIKSNEIMHGKISRIFHSNQTIFENLPHAFEAGRYHSLIVEKLSLPKELIIEAETSNNIIMGMRHRNHPTYGLQFHPESILTIAGQQIIENFLSICDRKVELC